MLNNGIAIGYFCIKINFQKIQKTYLTSCLVRYIMAITSKKEKKDENQKEGELKMLTKGLKVARAYFNIFESIVNFYFAYFRVLKTNTFA